MGLTQRDELEATLKMDPHSARSKIKAPMKAKRAPKRDLFAELSEGMTALALLRPESRKAGTRRATGVRLRAAARGYRRNCGSNVNAS
jgi:hypothetical protein